MSDFPFIKKSNAVSMVAKKVTLLAINRLIVYYWESDCEIDINGGDPIVLPSAGLAIPLEFYYGGDSFDAVLKVSSGFFYAVYTMP